MSGAGGVEREFKQLLPDRAALARLERVALARGATRSEPVLQRNQFLDTARGDLRRAALTLRLREESGRFELTAKGPASIRGEVHQRAELELELAPGQVQGVLEGRSDPVGLLEAHFGADRPLLAAVRSALAARPLSVVGGFENERTRVGPLPLADRTVQLELDRTFLPGGRVDHEVELEFPAGLEVQAAELARGLLEEAGVSGAPAQSKAARFFAALARTNATGC